MDEDAIKEMRVRKLNVVDVDDANRRTWLAEAEKAYPKLRGKYCPADLYDTVVKVRDEFRKTRTPARGK
jgi:hypothetical protein